MMTWYCRSSLRISEEIFGDMWWTKIRKHFTKQPSCVIIMWQISRDHQVERGNNSALEIIPTKNRTMEVETLDSKEQHDSGEQTEGHSVRSEVAIIQPALILINISRINQTNIINKDTIMNSIKGHQHQRMPCCWRHRLIFRINRRKQWQQIISYRTIIIREHRTEAGAENFLEDVQETII